MKEFLGLLTILVAGAAHGVSQDQIISNNTRAIVYLEVRDAAGAVLDRGSGFIVSHDGYIVTAAHMAVDPTQQMHAVIGQRAGTSFKLDFRDKDEKADVALWKLPQSAVCRTSVTLSSARPKVLDRVMALGFPGNDGLTPAALTINNLNSSLGFYKTDGDLRPGNSGGPVFNESGKVVAFVEGGAVSGAKNNDLVPVAPAIALLLKWGVQAGIDSAVPYAESCYASCRSPTHGVETWTTTADWGPVNSGWVGGSHSRKTECDQLIAGALSSNPGAQIELLPGEGTEGTTGMWEESKRDVLGHVEYKYFCKGKIRSGPVYLEKQSAACGLWN